MATYVQSISLRGFLTLYDATIDSVLTGALTGYIKVSGWYDVTKFWGTEGQVGKAYDSTDFNNLPIDSTQVPNVIPPRWRDKNGKRREWKFISVVVPDTDTMINVNP